MAALEHIANLFPRLELTNRVAILVPDAPFLDGLKPQLKAEFQARGSRSDQTPQQQYNLIEAREAAAALRWQGRSGDGEALVLDTIGNFDGLERLIVIAVGLDAPLDQGSEDVLETRSRLYRALTRAHMLAMVVNEAVRGGWLEWLNLIKLKEGQFDREAELARMKADAAEAEVKRRLEAIDKALHTAALEHGVTLGTLEHEHFRSLIDRAVTTDGQSLEAAADAQLDSWCTQKDALERALRMRAMTPSSAETSELLLRVAKQVSREPTANLDAAVQVAIQEWQMQASRRERDICIAQLCDADEGLHPDAKRKRMVERRAKMGGDSAEVAVRRAIRELRQDEALIAESVARLTGLSNRAAQQLQQEALGSVYEGGEEIPAAVERLFLEMRARAAVQEAAVQSMSGKERALLTKAVQVAIGRGEDATMATAREVARHQQVRAEVQGALHAKASLLGPKFDARSLEGRVCMAVLRGSPLAEEVAKHVKEFQEGLIIEQTVWDTGANSTSQPETLKFNPLQPELHDRDVTNLDDIDDDDALRPTKAMGAQLVQIFPTKLHRALTELDKIVIQVLLLGAIRLLCVKWLLMQPANFKMPNRQALEELERSGASPSPLLSPQEAAALVERGDRSIGALTYGWLSPGDPDPDGSRIRVLRRALARLTIEALFWDFGSLYQAPRTPEQSASFQLALRGGAMNQLYASILATTVLQIEEIPPRPAEFDGVVCLFVLSSNADESVVRAALIRFGTIESCDLSRSPAIVRFASHASAVSAKEAGAPPGLCEGLDTLYNETPYFSRGWCCCEDSLSRDLMKRLTAYPALRVHLDQLQPKVFALSSDADATPVEVEAGELDVAADIERIKNSKFTSKGDRPKVISLYTEYVHNTVGALTKTLGSLRSPPSKGAAGAPLGGRYQLVADSTGKIDILGSGAFGIVCRAVDLAQNTMVALKLIFNAPGLPLQAQVGGELVLQHIQPHANVVRLLDYYPSMSSTELPMTHLAESLDPQRPIPHTVFRCFRNGRFVAPMDAIEIAVLVYECIEGKELFDWLMEDRPEWWHGRDAAMDRPAESDVRGVMAGLVRAVAHLHSLGVCHRHLILENVMLTAAAAGVPPSERARLLDFGFAEAGPNIGQLNCGRTGTETYMAPEMHTALSYDGCKTDVFALGVCLYTLANKSPPWRHTRMNVAPGTLDED
eukprot:jgi/Chrpa1/17958/Chrysochromulina_OHIO_Genome00025903-RA